MAHVLAGWGDEDRRELLTLLDRLNDDFEEYLLRVHEGCSEKQQRGEKVG
jgi:hypothetical protein